MTIELTREQQNSVDYDAGDLLIKGVPGSGKSVVLMKRALRFNRDAIEKGENCKILIMTFTKTLTKYSRQLVSLAEVDPCMIELVNIDKEIWDVYHAMKKGWINRVSVDQRVALISEALQTHYERTKKPHRFYSIEPEFWAEEFLWIKQKHIKDAEQYISGDRAGRGGKVRMTREEKTVAYDLFLIYQMLLASKGLIDNEDLYTYVVDHQDKIPNVMRYDHVLVDEAQDLSFIQLSFAKALAKKTITIAADKAQKIYKTSFAWKDLNIDIRGNASKTLKKTFRSTKQIISLAESLQNVNRAFQEDLSEFTDPSIPEREGDLPLVIRCSDAGEEQDAVLGYIRNAEPEDTVGVLYRSSWELGTLQLWMNTEGIHYQMHTSDDFDLTAPGVKLCTLHSSKGLEFDIVIIPLFNSQVFPLASVLDDAEGPQIQEIEVQERNLLYVGMTRSRYELYLTYSGAPSKFLSEFDHSCYRYQSAQGDELEKPTFQGVTTEQLEQLKREKAARTADRNAKEQNKDKYAGFVVGAKVSHRKFGEGVISMRDGERVVVMIDGKPVNLMLGTCIRYGYLKLIEEAKGDGNE